MLKGSPVFHNFFRFESLHDAKLVWFFPKVVVSKQQKYIYFLKMKNLEFRHFWTISKVKTWPNSNHSSRTLSMHFSFSWKFFILYFCTSRTLRVGPQPVQDAFRGSWVMCGRHYPDRAASASGSRSCMDYGPYQLLRLKSEQKEFDIGVEACWIDFCWLSLRAVSSWRNDRGGPYWI